MQKYLIAISMISDERTIFLCFGVNAGHREMPKVGVATRLRMCIVHNLVHSLPLDSLASTPDISSGIIPSTYVIRMHAPR